jgi:ribonuclease D
MLIDDSLTLYEFCDQLRSAPYISVDTEFMREKTYEPLLCLVQVAYGEHAAAIDPLADGMDLTPLKDLLRDPKIVKVLHAADQDLEIFLNMLEEVPGPIFDTQIAAAVCGMGEQPGYAKVVEHILGIQIDKSSQLTDWSIRPLSDRQVQYAIGDVTHLCHIYESLSEQLEKTGRTSWIASDMEKLLEPSRYRTDPKDAYRRVKIRRPKRKTLAVLREVASWRERRAQERNIPRKWVAPDEALAEIAHNTPKTPKELGRVRKLNARGRDAEDILDAVQRGLSTPQEDWPPLPAQRDNVHADDSLVALLQALLRLRCEAHGVAMKLVANRSDLEKLAGQKKPDVPAMHGWRREVFGDDALALLRGELALTGRKGKVITLD